MNGISENIQKLTAKASKITQTCFQMFQFLNSYKSHPIYLVYDLLSRLFLHKIQQVNFIIRYNWTSSSYL